jgi:hypothetical protein
MKSVNKLLSLVTGYPYESPDNETSFSKGIPIKYLKFIQKNLIKDPIKFRYMFRGGSKPGYKRPQAYCHKVGAETFAIYKR